MIAANPFAVLGAARGHIRALHPVVRLWCGMCVFALALRTGLGSPLLFLPAVTGLALLWLGCRPSANAAKHILTLVALLNLPLVLLGILVHLITESPLGIALIDIALRTTLGTLASGLTIAALSVADLDAALHAVRCPRLVRQLVVMILLQAALMLDEVRRIAIAFAMRGVRGRLSNTLEVLRAFPLVWLVRTLDRGNRVARAMVQRGFDDFPVESVPFTRWDALATGIAGALIFAGIVLIREGGL